MLSVHPSILALLGTSFSNLVTQIALARHNWTGIDTVLVLWELLCQCIRGGTDLWMYYGNLQTEETQWLHKYVQRWHPVNMNSIQWLPPRLQQYTKKRYMKSKGVCGLMKPWKQWLPLGVSTPHIHTYMGTPGRIHTDYRNTYKQGKAAHPAWNLLTATLQVLYCTIQVSLSPLSLSLSLSPPGLWDENLTCVVDTIASLLLYWLALQRHTGSSPA